MPTRVHTTAARDTVRNSLISQKVVDAPLRTMRQGDQGAPVEKLQRALLALGYDVGTPNGKFNAKTKAAVEAFQATLPDVADSGVYGPKTRDALAVALRKRDAQRGPTLQQNFRGAAVKRLEQKLAAAGLFKGKADGFYDAQTAKAVRQLEKQQGLKVDGVADARVWQALGGAGAGSGRKLQLGAKGLAVEALQTRLAELGLYKGKVSGTFDAATRTAVRAFEKREGVAQDGVVDGNLWNRLRVHVRAKEIVGGPKLKEGYRGQAVRILETRLKELGIFKGKVDGVFDKATKAAVQTFERRRGVKADGVVGNALWEKLGGAGLGSGPTLENGASGDAVKVLQRNLKAKGLYAGPIDGQFGAQTGAAVRKLEKREGLKVDGVVNGQVWRALGRHVVSQRIPETWKDAKAPAHNYSRVWRNGEQMNARTLQMLQRAEKYAKQMGVRVPFFVVQGSYSNDVSASGGTHDHGGALDLRTWDRPRSEVVKMVKALRMAGFAAWKRGYGGDTFDPHIHVIAIGDKQLSSSARNQVREYFAGGDGLIGSAPDGDRHEAGRPIPKWALKFR